jgi:putative transposase
LENALILQEIFRIREKHPRIGGRKLHHMLQDFLADHQIKMGRDAVFNLLSDNNLLVKSRKRSTKTTHSFHWLRKYPNLIRELQPTAICQLWVSDITYWKVNESFLYISLMTNAYSHKVVGYHLAETLEAVHSLQALKMAINQEKCYFEQANNLIHHSDRGIQYCSHQYVNVLQDNGIQISMTENGDPLENAMAERVNGILKEEYLKCWKVDNFADAQQLFDKVIQYYNQERPHSSIGNFTPAQVHENKNVQFSKLWKNYSKKSNTFVNTSQDNPNHVNSTQDCMV